jgi:thiol-disulfide isomerase/thioredoxin
MGITSRSFLAVIFSFRAIFSFAAPVTIKGNIANTSGEKKVYLYVYHGDMLIPKDSVSQKNGNFSFKSGTEGFPQGMYRIGFSRENSSTIILGKEEFELKIDAKSWENPVCLNSAENAVFGRYNASTSSLNAKIQKLEQKYREMSGMAQTNPQGFQQALSGLRQKADSLFKDHQLKLNALKNENPSLYMAKVLDFIIDPTDKTGDNFITQSMLEDPGLQRTNFWDNRFTNLLRRFGEENPEKWLSLTDKVVNQTMPKTPAREIALRAAAKALLPLEQSGEFSAYNYAKTYIAEFPGSESRNFLKQFSQGPPGEGEMAPDITLADREGKILPLSSTRGKVVLLDFWASWCGPCRMENPNVVKAYEKYKNKGFTVFSVSLDQSKDKWLAAIAKDGLVWENHVSDLKGWGSAGAALYQVRGIPATFLLDKTGKIIARNLRGPALEKKLEELLGP